MIIENINIINTSSDLLSLWSNPTAHRTPHTLATAIYGLGCSIGLSRLPALLPATKKDRRCPHHSGLEKQPAILRHIMDYRYQNHYNMF